MVCTLCDTGHVNTLVHGFVSGFKIRFKLLPASLANTLYIDYEGMHCKTVLVLIVCYVTAVCCTDVAAAAAATISHSAR